MEGDAKGSVVKGPLQTLANRMVVYKALCRTPSKHMIILQE